ncbi:MAG: septum formation initiator family protein [Raoultibacter sp.]
MPAKRAAGKGAQQSGVSSGASSREESSPVAAEKSSWFANLKRMLRKTKADKAFEAHYADTNKPATESAGSRAALYKGQMGSSHKRSARMQAQAKSVASSKASTSQSLRGKIHSPYCAGGAIVAVCLVLSCAFLYPAAKDYYVAVREQAQVQAEYAALDQRNAAIQAEVDRLSTSEGIEDKARKEFGWVKAGDNSVSVYGLDKAKRTNLNANVAENSIPAPDTWYSALLDALFGVDTSSAAGK